MPKAAAVRNPVLEVFFQLRDSCSPPCKPTRLLGEAQGHLQDPGDFGTLSYPSSTHRRTFHAQQMPALERKCNEHIC
ncbi:hypothetical protein VULLAG_LOCUS16482 [Vulpes lagopus]